MIKARLMACTLPAIVRHYFGTKYYDKRYTKFGEGGGCGMEFSPLILYTENSLKLETLTGECSTLTPKSEKDQFTSLSLSLSLSPSPSLSPSLPSTLFQSIKVPNNMEKLLLSLKAVVDGLRC